MNRSIRDIPLPDRESPEESQGNSQPTHESLTNPTSSSNDHEDTTRDSVEDVGRSEQPTSKPLYQTSSSKKSPSFAARPMTSYAAAQKGHTFKKIVIGLLVVALLGGSALFAISYFSKNLTLALTPETFAFEIDESYQAAADADAGEIDLVEYQILPIQDPLVHRIRVAATDDTEVTASTGAAGTVTITNSGSETVRLVNRTRFADESGNILRITEAVSIDAGDSVTVNADAEEGVLFNRGSGALKAPGLEGDANYDLVTATIATGFLVDSPDTEVVEDEEVTTVAAASLLLRQDLTNRFLSFVGKDFYPLTEAIEVDIQSEVIEEGGEFNTVELIGTVSGAIIEKKTLINLIKATSPQLQSNNITYTLESFDDLEITLDGSDDIRTLTISGSGLLVAKISTDEIKEAIKGKHLKQVTAPDGVLAQFPAIKDAEIATSFLRFKVPEDETEITIEVTNS